MEVVLSRALGIPLICDGTPPLTLFKPTNAADNSTCRSPAAEAVCPPH